MWGQDSQELMGLALGGFAAVIVCYGGYAVKLLRDGLLAHHREAPAVALAVAVLASLVWGIFGFVDQLSVKTLPWHVALACDHVRYTAWAAFLILLLHPAPNGRGALGGLPRAALPCALLVAGSAANAAVAVGWPSPGGALRALAGAQLALSIGGLVLVEQVFRNQSESARWAAKPLCLGLGCIFGYDLYLFAQAVVVGGVDADVLQARTLAHSAAVPLLLAASRREAHWFSRIRVSNATAFYSASLLLVGAYLLVVAAAGYYVRFFGGKWGGVLQVALMTAALLTLLGVMLSATQRARMRVFLAKHFFSYHYDYRVEWLHFTARLSARGAAEDVGQQVVRSLADLVECPAGSLWTRVSAGSHYAQTATWNVPRVTAAEAGESAFSRLLREREWIIDFAAAARGDDHGAALAPPAWVVDAGPLWLAIPLLVGDDMPGFVLLAPPRTPMTLNWEVRDLLKTAARQAAGYLALMHTTEALIETRKFDAFARMSAFVVHDLKNIVTQLALMMKNAERHRDNPEFQKDMLLTVENSLDKMKQLMLQLREGERPEGVAAGVELVPLLRRLQSAALQRGRDVTIDASEGLATRGHAQRLERVVGHLVQNALDATPPDGRVGIALSRHGGRVRVVVEDSGTGMTEDFIRTRLFRPFNSTKHGGMGIGAYESLQYVKELGGDVDVRSTIGVGSVVTLTLPAFELDAGAPYAAGKPAAAA